MTGPTLNQTLTKGDSLSSKPTRLQWDVPAALKIPPDTLRARLDFFSNSIMLYTLDDGMITAQHVSADDVATSLLSVAQFFTGILPAGVLWYIRKEAKIEVALYEGPRIRQIAVETAPLKPPERFKIPTPGLIFICTPQQAPRIFAAKSRPSSMESDVFNAPYNNIYADARTCAGTQQYNEDISKIPDEFFNSFFSLHLGDKRSKSHPASLFALYKELDGKKDYPMDDLTPYGKIKDII